MGASVSEGRLPYEADRTDGYRSQGEVILGEGQEVPRKRPERGPVLDTLRKLTQGCPCHLGVSELRLH